MYKETKHCSFLINNPLKTWWKVRKYFRKPKMSIHFFKDIYHSVCPYASLENVAPWVEVRCVPEHVKLKEYDWSHESDPYIWVCFFRKFGFRIDWKITYKDKTGRKHDGGTEYWEYLYECLYDKRDLYDVPEWTSYHPENGEMVGENAHIERFCLRKKYLKEYEKINKTH